MCSNCGDSVNSRASLGKASQKTTPTFLWALPKLAKLIFTFFLKVKMLLKLVGRGEGPPAQIDVDSNNLGNSQNKGCFFLGSLPFWCNTTEHPIYEFSTHSIDSFIVLSYGCVRLIIIFLFAKWLRAIRMWVKSFEISRCIFHRDTNTLLAAWIQVWDVNK